MMVFVYAKIFIAARSRARKHIAQKRFKIPATSAKTSNDNNKNGNNESNINIEKATTTNVLRIDTIAKKINNVDECDSTNSLGQTFKNESTIDTLCTSFTNNPNHLENLNVHQIANQTNDDVDRINDFANNNNIAHNDDDNNINDDDYNHHFNDEFKDFREKNGDNDDSFSDKNRVENSNFSETISANNDHHHHHHYHHQKDQLINECQPQIRPHFSLTASNDSMLEQSTQAMIEENRIRRSDRIAEDLNENCSSEIESDRNLDINAATISIKTVPPRIIIETSNESRQQSSNIISNKSELLSPFYPNTETDSEQQQQNQQQQEQHRRQRKQRPNFTKNGSPKNLRSIDKKIKKNNHSHHHHNLFKQQQKNHQYHFSCDVLDSKKHKIEPDEEEEEDEGGGQEGEERKLRRKNVKSRRSWKEDENDLESNNDDVENGDETKKLNKISKVGSKKNRDNDDVEDDQDEEEEDYENDDYNVGIDEEQNETDPDYTNVVDSIQVPIQKKRIILFKKSKFLFLRPRINSFGKKTSSELKQLSNKKNHYDNNIDEGDVDDSVDGGGYDDDGSVGRNDSINKKCRKSNNLISDDESDPKLESPTIKKPIRFETKSFLSAPKLLRSRFGSTLSIADYEDSDTVDDDKISLGKSRNRFDNNGSKNNNNYEINNGDRSPYHHHNPGHRSIHLPNDAERHKRKIAKARERRATLIVGLIMAAFIIAWLPFFVLYVLVALCQACKESTPQGIFSVAFWLGYGNSGE